MQIHGIGFVAVRLLLEVFDDLLPQGRHKELAELLILLRVLSYERCYQGGTCFAFDLRWT